MRDVSSGQTKLLIPHSKRKVHQCRSRTAYEKKYAESHRLPPSCSVVVRRGAWGWTDNAVAKSRVTVTCCLITCELESPSLRWHACPACKQGADFCTLPGQLARDYRAGMTRGPGNPLREDSHNAQKSRLGWRRTSFSTAFHFFRSSRARWMSVWSSRYRSSFCSLR